MSKKQKAERSPEERRAYWEGDLLPLSVVVEHIKESRRQFFNKEFTMMYDLMYQVIATFPVHGFHNDLHIMLAPYLSPELTFDPTNSVTGTHTRAQETPHTHSHSHP
jgi:hypothetical protein